MIRLTDTDKWKTWLIHLPPEYRLLWLYINDECNTAGIYTVSEPLIRAYVGDGIEIEKALEYFGKRIFPFNNGNKWLITTFLFEQEKGVLNWNHNRQHSIILTLAREGILNRIIKSIETGENLKKPGEKIYQFYVSDRLLSKEHILDIPNPIAIAIGIGLPLFGNEDRLQVQEKEKVQVKEKVQDPEEEPIQEPEPEKPKPGTVRAKSVSIHESELRKDFSPLDPV